MLQNKSELIALLNQIERDKGLKKEDILKMLEQALVSAYRKHAGHGVNIEAKINPDTGEVKALVTKRVVKDVNDAFMEIAYDEVVKSDPSTSLGAEIQVPVDTDEFARIAAQTAKQVLVQKIRETERENIYEEYRPKEGVILTGVVQRHWHRDTVVDLGRVEAILPAKEQVKREHWSPGDHIKALMVKVDKGPRGPEIILSRTHPDFVKQLFEHEIPEIYENTVEIVSIARDPGFRSKIIVKTNNTRVDPVGACVGIRGSRIRPIIDELQGERIDLIPYSQDPVSMITAALAPAKVVSVTVVNANSNHAEVLVSDDMLSLAIGKAGQNVRLASKLTGWHIDIKSDKEKRREVEINATVAVEALACLDGVGPKTAEVLVKGGWNSVEKLAAAKVEEITVLSGIGEKTAANIIDGAKRHLDEKNNNGQNKQKEENGNV